MRASGSPRAGQPEVFLPGLGRHGSDRKTCDEGAAAGYEGFLLPSVKVAETTGA